MSMTKPSQPNPNSMFNFIFNIFKKRCRECDKKVWWVDSYHLCEECIEVRRKKQQDRMNDLMNAIHTRKRERQEMREMKIRKGRLVRQDDNPDSIVFIDDPKGDITTYTSPQPIDDYTHLHIDSPNEGGDGGSFGGGGSSDSWGGSSDSGSSSDSSSSDSGSSDCSSGGD